MSGSEHPVDIDPEMPPLWALCDVIGPIATKFGYGIDIIPFAKTTLLG